MLKKFEYHIDGAPTLGIAITRDLNKEFGKTCDFTYEVPPISSNNVNVYANGVIGNQKIDNFKVIDYLDGLNRYYTMYVDANNYFILLTYTDYLTNDNSTHSTITSSIHTICFNTTKNVLEIINFSRDTLNPLNEKPFYLPNSVASASNMYLNAMFNTSNIKTDFLDQNPNRVEIIPLYCGCARVRNLYITHSPVPLDKSVYANGHEYRSIDPRLKLLYKVG